MTHPIYIAGSSAEPARVRWAMDAINATPGLRVAHDWLASIERGAPANAELSLAERRTYAADDLRAVHAAAVVWFLAPEKPTRGAWLEVGYALALGKVVIVSGDTAQSIFCALAVECSCDADALQLIQREIAGVER